jgi:methanogenic corrinoid protein MtbC1
MSSMSQIQTADCWTAACAVRGAVSCSWQYDCLAERATLPPKPSYPDIVSRPAGEGAFDARKAKLAHTIEAEIIPRLMMAHQFNIPAPSLGVCETAGKPDVAQFAELVMTREATSAIACAASLLDQGMTVEAIYLDLLAPTARRLGDLWTEDLVYFTDVAIGLTRLQNVMTSIGEIQLGKTPNRTSRPRALLVSMRGEMHNFGLFMVANFFRRANWDVRSWPLVTDEELMAAIREEPRDVIGFSVSSPEQVDRTQAAIGLIRKASRNRVPKIMVGGPYFIENPHAAAEIGADATSPDGFSAVEIATKLIQSAESSEWRKSA